ncbi:NADP-dependent oxidoreductase domain-containing protein [Lipomyces starkeyi]
MSTGRVFKLNDGNFIPALGLGTWQSPDKEVYEAVLVALKTGYRHIDAAFPNLSGLSIDLQWMLTIYASAMVTKYQLAKLLKTAAYRESVFLTSKLWSTGHTRVAEDLEASLKNLGVDYLDLYLMHWPVTLNPKGNHPLFPTTTTGARDLLPEEEWNYIKTWAAMQALLKTGKVKSIGVANFSTHHLEQLASAPTTTVVPTVNQGEQSNLLFSYVPLRQIVEIVEDLMLYFY